MYVYPHAQGVHVAIISDVLHQFWSRHLEAGLYLYCYWYLAGLGNLGVKTSDPSVTT